MTSIPAGSGEFNWSMYGAMVRQARKHTGIKRAKDFGTWLLKKTGVYISRDVVYKIEQGRQVPTGEQMAALNLALFGEAFPSWLVFWLASDKWRDLETNSGKASLEEVLTWQD